MAEADADAMLARMEDANTADSGGEITADDENIYEVEKIVGMSVMDGQTMYRVRWLNYSPQHDTWEPYENLITCKDLVEEYASRPEQQKKKKRPVDEKPVKRKRRNSDKSREDKSEPIPTSSPVETPTENKQLKDTFWKDLEEGRINVFEQDMYSKVKGRSSRHQAPHDESPKGGNGNGNGNKQHKHKSGGNANSSDSATDPGHKEHEHDQQKTKRFKKRKKSVGSDTSSTGNVRPDADAGVAAKAAVSPSTTPTLMEAASKSDKTITKATTATDNRGMVDVQTINALPTIEQQVADESVNTHCNDKAKEDKTEVSDKKHDGEDVRLSALPVNNNNTSNVSNTTKETVKEKPVAQPKGSGDISYSFEFTKYNPEEWVVKDAIASGQAAQLSNSEFRDAVKRGDYELLRRALNCDHITNLEQTDANGMTLLMIASASGFDDIVELLIIHGANINAVQKTGATALMLAADLGHVCCVAVLLGLGAHVDITQHSGETALMKACKRGFRPIVQLLLEQGANFAMVTNSDTTALKLAKQYDHPAIQHLLTDHISRVTAAFEVQVNITLNNTAQIVHALFPLHCFSLNEGTSFRINFNYQLQPSEPGVGMLLFIAHSRITSQEVKCRFYGPCAVICALLNGVRQSSLTEEANFVLSFSPLNNGKNDLVINTIPSSSSKAKLLVCAYKAKLMGNSKLS